MFKIDQHIEILLLKHDCVIVPGFGGFVVHSVPARYDKTDGMMLPPATTVGFNPQLTINDSLLIQSYIEAYDMSYPEAQREVDSETEVLKGLIADNGYFDIHSVGRLSINTEGNYIFEPCQAGTLVPRLYGLSGIETSEEGMFLKQPGRATNTVADETAVEKETANTITINTSTLRKVAVACVLIVCTMLLPFLSHNQETMRMLGGIDTTITSLIQPRTETTIKGVVPEKKTYHVYVHKKKPESEVITHTEMTQPKETAIEAKTETHIETKTAETKPAGKRQPETPAVKEKKHGPLFAVVLASRVPKASAEEYAGKLKGRGLKDVRVIGEGKSRKVVMGAFTNEDDALQCRKEMNQQEEFASAWVVRIE